MNPASPLFVLALSCAPKEPALPAPATPAAAETSALLAAHTEQMHTWFQGEFSNHEQVLEQEQGDTEPYDLLHQIFVPVDVPALGEHVLFVQQHKSGETEPYRVRIYALHADPTRDAVRLDIHKPSTPGALHNLHLDPDRAASLDAEADLELAVGCSVWWTPEGKGYTGSTDPGTCRVASQRTGETLVFSDTLLLTEERLHIQDVAHREDGSLRFGHPDGDPHKLRKLSWYTGWSVVRPGGPDHPPDTQEWSVHKGLHLHSEGGRVALVDASGASLPYTVELARLTRSGSNTHLLKLTLRETETDAVLAYSWTDPHAERIGMNLGWAQIGLTREALTPHLGFDSEEASPLVRELATRLTGRLTSAAQAEQDPRYRTIVLNSCPVAAPGLGQTVLYVEQAVAEAPDKPYRQRLYVLEALEDATVRSSIYTLTDPASAVGLCNEAGRRSFHVSEATLREGCAVDLAFDGRDFRGETEAKACASSLRGANHATVAVTVTPEGLDSWDRGWNAEGEQVWGAEAGPYAFRRGTEPEEDRTEATP